MEARPLSRLSRKLLCQEQFDRFLAQRNRLQSYISDFPAPKTLDNAPAKAAPIVLLYGSSVSGTAFNDGDADFTIAFSSVETVPGKEVSCSDRDQAKCSFLEIPRNHQERVLSELYEHIKRKCGEDGIAQHRIFRARIPIVQYTERTAGNQTKFDLSLSLNGVRNSVLLRQYMENDPRLRLGVLCAKQWGKEERLLNARRGWISPYALTIMYIYYMISTRRTPIHLNELSMEGFIARVAQTAISQNDNLDSFPEFHRVVPLQLVDLDLVADDVHGFFDFYATPTVFDFDDSVVDIRKTEPIHSKQDWIARLEEVDAKERWHLLGHEVLMLRDPFEPHNLGRSVDFFRGEAIREALRLAAAKKKPLSFLD